MRDGSRLYETEDYAEQFGTIRLEYDGKRLVVWVGGEIVFRRFRPPLIDERVFITGHGSARVISVNHEKAWVQMDSGSDALVGLDSIQIS